jgi:optic atrophy 3 protein
MRLSVAALRDVAAEQRAKEKAETPTVKTEEQMKADEAAKEKASAEKEASKSIWKRKFRPLPEAKAVDLFADVIGDAFILAIGMGLIIYEYVRTSGKPDTNAVKIAELDKQLKEEEARIAELEETERKQHKRVEVLEEALAALQTSPKNNKSVSPS